MEPHKALVLQANISHPGIVHNARIVNHCQEHKMDAKMQGVLCAEGQGPVFCDNVWLAFRREPHYYTTHPCASPAFVCHTLQEVFVISQWWIKKGSGIFFTSRSSVFYLCTFEDMSPCRLNKGWTCSGIKTAPFLCDNTTIGVHKGTPPPPCPPHPVTTQPTLCPMLPHTATWPFLQQ